MTRRRGLGIALVAGGGVLVTLAGARYVEGAVVQDRARREWEAASAHSAVDAARATQTRARGAAAKGAPVARLLIPRIGLDEIVLEGVDDDALNGGPGHFPGSSLPGDVGNSIISGHRDRHFRHFGDLAIGDTVRTESAAGATTWVIVSRRLVAKDAPALFPSAEARLTLTTCWPIGFFGPAPERLIVTAKPVSTPTG